MPLLMLAFALCAPPSTDGVLEVRLEGPLVAVHLDGVRVPTRVVTDLAPAEAITVRVPWLPVDPTAEPKLRVVEGEGGARVEEIHPAPMAAPGDLSRRPLPRPMETPARIPPVAWWLFVAGLLAVGAARRRPMSAAIVGGAFGLVLTVLPTVSQSAPVVAVLEVGPWGAWWVHVGVGELEPPAAAHPALVTQPVDANWEWVVDASDPARPRRIARANAGTHLIARSLGPVPPEAPKFLEEWLSGQGELEEVWRRTEEGDWTYHGTWASGAPLPASGTGELMPTWLRAGATPGAIVWVGRLSEVPQGTDQAWVRVIWGPW